MRKSIIYLLRSESEIRYSGIPIFEPPRKSKLVQIIGRFKELGVKLQLLTGERKIRFVPKSEFYLKPVELKIESRLIKKRVH